MSDDGDDDFERIGHHYKDYGQPDRKALIKASKVIHHYY
jgi:hypothetical protein